MMNIIIFTEPSIAFDLVQYTMRGYVAGVKSLLDKYPHIVNAKITGGITAAIAAAKRNDLSLLEHICQYGTDLSITDFQGRDVMYWAKRHDNIAMQEFIETAVRVQPVLFEMLIMLPLAIEINCARAISNDSF